MADPEMLQLSRVQLCEEAICKRQLCVSSMEQMCLCIDDYQKAEAGAVGAPGERFSGILEWEAPQKHCWDSN